MDAKTLTLLEFPKILEKLAGYTAFAASAEKARALRPTTEIDLARRWQIETTEAVSLISTHTDITIGGARDVREPVDLAAHGAVLTAAEMLDIKSTLIAARTLARTFERLNHQFPSLSEIAQLLPSVPGLVDTITRAISDRGDILDSASDKLGGIRRDMRIAHERLMSKMQRLVSDPNNAQMLQEAIITQRDGRYVLPLRAEFKGRLKSIVHDQSASGATLFVEPLAVVELNNKYRELQLAERDEERRILADLSRQVGMYAGAILQTVERVAELDLAFAKGKFSLAMRANQPVLHEFPRKTLWGKGHPGSVIRLYQARHPLLDQNTVVPIDLELDDQTFALIVTGPNTGGKTVTLKTVGLSVLMAQSGMHILVHTGSEISLFDKIFADIGDEQSIEQSLSTFSGHVTNIIHILEKADRRSLVILDELGAGTDPQEGAALARAILSSLLERGITTLVTTHHPELKAYAHATPGVVNASAEFDLETLRPTYHLTIGLPGRSNALAIAERLGMPQEIISSARSGLDPTDLRAEDLLDEIHRQRDQARQARAAAEKGRLEAESLRNELLQRLDRIEDERRKTIEQARQAAERELIGLRDELEQVRRALARARQPLEAVEAAESQMEAIEEEIEQAIERHAPDLSETLPVLAPIRRGIRLGDKVYLRKINMQGVVTALSEEEADVQVGALRVRARIFELEHPGSASSEAEQSLKPTGRRKKILEAAAAPPASETHSDKILPASPGMELDIRGHRADDALEKLDRYLDAAYLAGMPFVRIIHGKGTGRLRQVVREALAQNAHVFSYESGGEKEGGDGVTVAKMAGA